VDPNEKVQLGNTELRVTRLGFGGAAIAGLYSDVPDAMATATVQRALALGINFFDIAPLYGAGKGELRMGRALAGVKRDSYVLASKVGRLLEPDDSEQARDMLAEFGNPRPFRPDFDFSYEGAMRSFEESLKRLNLDRIDILHIHDPTDYYEQAMAGAYRALFELRSEGVIRALGVGMNQAEMLVRFARDGDFDCFLLAGRYTLIDQVGLKDLLPLCVKKCISIIIGGPFNSGILATGARPGAKFNYQEAPTYLLDRVHQLESVCMRYSVPLRAAALQFPLAHPAVASVIPGCRSVTEVEENCRLIKYPIPESFWDELRERKLLPKEAPVPEGAVSGPAATQTGQGQ